MSGDRNIRIVRRGVGKDGEDYFEIEYMSHLKWKKRIFSARDIASSTALRKIGIVTSTSKAAFAADIEVAMRDMISTFAVADRAGWFGDTFVWPDGVCTGDEVPVCLGPDYRHERTMERRGTLAGWRELTNLARGNTRVTLAICHGFTGPVVDLLGIEAPAIQIVGEVGVGKTTIARIVALMWGVDKKSWHATDNGGEQVALARHATHLVLDDFRVDKKHPYVDLRAYAIRLTDGRSKERMGEPGQDFRSPILSTANHSIDEFARLAGLTIDVDQHALRGRLNDVPLLDRRTQLFEDLHGYKSAQDLFLWMIDLAKENTGVLADEYVYRLHVKLCEDRVGWVRWLQDERAYYEEQAGAAHENLPGYDLARVHGRFATIYAAGRLAIELRLLRWSPPYLLQAILDCEAAHVALAADTGWGALDGSPLTALRRHVAIHWHSLIDLRRGLLEREGHDHDACPGYLNRRRDGSLELLFAYPLVERICGGRAAMPLLRIELRNAGALFEGEARPSVKRFIYLGKDPNERENVVAVRADMFDPNERTWP